MKNLVIPQLVPQEFCLQCEVCCRFVDKFSPWSPFILKEEIRDFDSQAVLPFFVKSYGINLKPIKNNNIYICPFFNLAQKKCSLYEQRPLDCQLYPFVIFYNQYYTEVNLGIDLQCPYLKNREINNLLNIVRILKEILEREEVVELIYQNPGIIMSHNVNFHPLSSLDKISSRIFGKGSGLKIISFKDKGIFNEFLLDAEGNFSYVFEYLYSWKDVAYLLWEIVDNNLLVFFKQGESCFLILPPLGSSISPEAIAFSRWFTGKNLIIENISESRLNLFKKNNFRMNYKNLEYIYDRINLIGLKGKNSKSQRWAYNYFRRNYPARVEELISEKAENCIGLYELWAKERLEKDVSSYYRLLIEDNFFAQRRLLIDYDSLDLRGIVIEIENKIIGYSFGYPINKENFCIFAEVADLRFRGIAQYIFREFCRELKDFRFINTMDDSELTNLREKKLSHHPLATRPFYSCQSDY